MTRKAPDDHFLADVWRDVSGEKPKNWLHYLHNKATTAEEPVRDQLAAAGVLTLSTKRSLLSPIASHQVTVNDPQQQRRRPRSRRW
ncbi:GPP34 family phosphoprotein [Actinoallomurus sp. CA-142502]|uniref:GPP34 family phosphoprotein n=1 Tax=Actinoallomurus sp. CA-142502 TaxID=3239885 RepID=UPI003D94AAE5